VPEVPVEDVALEHVSIDAPTGLRIGYTRNITLYDVHIRAQQGPPVTIADTVTGVKWASDYQAPDSPVGR
jgi:hypothetical protein